MRECAHLRYMGVQLQDGTFDVNAELWTNTKIVFEWVLTSTSETKRLRTSAACSECCGPSHGRQQNTRSKNAYTCSSKPSSCSWETGWADVPRWRVKSLHVSKQASKQANSQPNKHTIKQAHKHTSKRAIKRQKEKHTTQHTTKQNKHMIKQTTQKINNNGNNTIQYNTTQNTTIKQTNKNKNAARSSARI